MTIRRCENCIYYGLDNPYGGDIREEWCVCESSKNYHKHTRSNDGCIEFESKIKKKVLRDD